MFQFSSLLPSFFALGLVMAASVLLTANRPRLSFEVRTSSRFFTIVGLTILVQSLHFYEELRSGFFVRFPEAFGLRPFSEDIFVTFNVAWIAIWAVSLFAVRAGYVIAVCPLWFLALAMVLNLVAHPILALRDGGYFPGLLTSPLVGLLGLLSTRELVRVTALETG